MRPRFFYAAALRDVVGAAANSPPFHVLRRRIAAVGLTLAAVAGLTQGFLELAFDYPPDAAGRLAELGVARDRALAVAALFAIAQLALVPGVLGLASLVPTRRAMLAHLAAGVALVGLFGHAAVAGANLVRVDMADPSSDPAQMRALYERADANPVYLAFTAAGLLGFAIGFLLMGIALLGSPGVPKVLPILLIAGLVAEFAFASLPYGSLAGLSLFAIALVGLAWVLVSEPDHGSTPSVPAAPAQDPQPPG